MAVMAPQSSQAGLFFDLTNDSDLEVEETFSKTRGSPILESIVSTTTATQARPKRSYSSSDSSSTSLSTYYPSPSSSSSSASSASSSYSSSSSEDEVEWLSSSKRGKEVLVSRGKSIPIAEGNERVSLEDSRSEPLGNVKANPSTSTPSSSSSSSASSSSSRRLEKAEDTTDEEEEGRCRKRQRRILNEDSASDSDVEFVRIVTTKEPEAKEPELISSESETERRHRRIEELTYEALFGKKESEHETPSSSTSSTSSSKTPTSRKHPPIVIDLSADDSEAESSAPKIVAEEEDVCPICLGDFQDPAIPDGCKHTFCFVCILQWSEINPSCLCPLCKSHFTALYHDIQSSTDFKRYKIEPPKPAPKPSHHPSYLRRTVRTQPNQYRGRPRRWPTLAEQYEIEERERRRRREEESDEDERSSSSRRERRSSRHYELTEAQERRRRVHTGRLRLHTEDLPPDARKVGNASTMRRDWTSRIESWVKRELQSILYQRDVSILLAFVEGVVTRFDINTASGFRNAEKELEPYLDDYTRIFVAELLAFVESGLRMDAYDNAIRYGP